MPGPHTAAENVALAIKGITVGAPVGVNLKVTLSVTHGTLSLGSTVGNGSKSLTLTGTSADLNAALATLTYLGGHDYSGPDTLNLNVSDVSDGSLNTSGSLAITVQSPAQQAAALQALVTGLQAAGALNQGQANSLNVKLNLKDNNGDIGKVQAFLQEVADLLAADILTQAQANTLLGPGDNLLLSLTQR
jgi:hypothetical protein